MINGATDLPTVRTLMGRPLPTGMVTALSSKMESGCARSRVGWSTGLPSSLRMFRPCAFGGAAMLWRVFVVARAEGGELLAESFGVLALSSRPPT